MEISLIIFALISGVLNGIGSSGGMLFMSAMLLNGFHPIVATATNKVVALIGSFGALKNYWLYSEKIENNKGLYILSVTGVLLGASLALKFDEGTLGKAYCILTFLLLVALLLSHKFKGVSIEKNKGGLKRRKLFIGMFSGAYNGFFGPGTIIVASLQFRILANCKDKEGISTAVTLNTITNAAACFVLGVGILSVLEVEVFLLSALILSNIVGQYFGSLFVVRSDAKYVEFVSKATVFILLIVLVNEYWFRFY